MKQLYITDLDHTFLNSNQKVSDFSKEIWNSISQKARLTVATARSFAKIEEFLNGMVLNSPLILLDGSLIVTAQKEIIDIKPMDKSLVDEIIYQSKKFDIEPFLLALENREVLSEAFIVPQKKNIYQSTLIDDKYIHDSRLRVEENIKGVKDTLKVVYIGDKTLLLLLSEQLKKIFSTNIEIKLAPEHYMGCWFLTILHPLGDKAHAIKKVSEYLNIPLKDITVFGDNINDIEMFKIAGTSVAVSNALDEVKKEAIVILPHSNDEDGVARYLIENVI
ncbi:MAG: Cof-type HAD-IIB family hydrolase [Sulfurovaceae bacterium]|nr:Cof-type HAD-IIB family hydrolase [Sulfurovaceae bacterium]